MYSEEVINLVRQVPIVEVVTRLYQEPKMKKGRYLFARSPWGRDRTPSFSVDPVNNIFKDFSSGKGGSVITFAMEFEALTFIEALKLVAAIGSIELPKADGELKINSPIPMYKQWTGEWSRELIRNEPLKKLVMEYYGLSEETLLDFNVGFCSKDWKPGNKFGDLPNRMKLLRPNHNMADGYSFFFRRRIMFPIHDSTGNVIGYSARQIPGHEDPDKGKYINSAESEFYKKRETIYNLHRARKHIRTREGVTILEGQTDVATLWQLGIKNVVSPLGTAFTDEQAKTIAKYTDNVTLLYDGDKAGRIASHATSKILAKHSILPNRIILPEGEDPNSLYQKIGPHAFMKYLSENYYTFNDFFAHKIRSCKGAHEIRIAVKEFADIVNDMPMEFERGGQTMALAEDTGIAYEELISFIKIGKIEDSNLEVKGWTPYEESCINLMRVMEFTGHGDMIWSDMEKKFGSFALPPDPRIAALITLCALESTMNHEEMHQTESRPFLTEVMYRGAPDEAEIEPFITTFIIEHDMVMLDHLARNHKDKVDAYMKIRRDDQ